MISFSQIMNALEYVGVASTGTKMLFFDFPQIVARFNGVSRGGRVFRLNVVGRVSRMSVVGRVSWLSVIVRARRLGRRRMVGRASGADRRRDVLGLALGLDIRRHYVHAGFKHAVRVNMIDFCYLVSKPGQVRWGSVLT